MTDFDLINKLLKDKDDLRDTIKMYENKIDKIKRTISQAFKDNEL